MVQGNSGIFELCYDLSPKNAIFGPFSSKESSSAVLKTDLGFQKLLNKISFQASKTYIFTNHDSFLQTLKLKNPHFDFFPPSGTLCKAAPPVPTPPSPPRTAQTRKMRSPMPKVQQRIPGGDKEYRDATRNNRNPPYAPTFNNNMPEEIHLAPNAPRSRDASPKSKEFWCAWCTENGRTHQHSTANCSMLQYANANDQWKVINKHKVCDSCLVQGHYWKHCPNKIQECCTECGNSHHPNLQCMPLKQASTYPGTG